MRRDVDTGEDRTISSKGRFILFFLVGIGRFMTNPKIYGEDAIELYFKKCNLNLKIY